MTLRNKGTGADTVLNFKRGGDINACTFSGSFNGSGVHSSVTFPTALLSMYKTYTFTWSGGSATSNVTLKEGSTTIGTNKSYTRNIPSGKNIQIIGSKDADSASMSWNLALKVS